MSFPELPGVPVALTLSSLLDVRSCVLPLPSWLKPRDVYQKRDASASLAQIEAYGSPASGRPAHRHRATRWLTFLGPLRGLFDLTWFSSPWTSEETHLAFGGSNSYRYG